MRCNAQTQRGQKLTTWSHQAVSPADIRGVAPNLALTRVVTAPKWPSRYVIDIMRGSRRVG